MTFHLAIRNVYRHKVRTAMTLAAIVSGVAGLILAGGFVQDIFVQLGEAIIHSQTGHVQVFKRDFLDKGSRRPEQYLIDDPASVMDKIRSQQDVRQVAARLSFSGLLNNGRRDLAIVGEGIEAEKEARLGTFLKIIAGRQLGDGDGLAMIAGQGVAESLALEPGDFVTLVVSTADGALNSLEFELVGVFQSFSKEFDAHAVRISLPAAQELMFTSGANLLVVTLDATDRTDAAAAGIGALLGSGELEVRNWRQIADFYEKTVQLYKSQFGVLQWIILAMVLLSVVNSVNMSCYERVSEFGTMLALGNRPRDIFSLLVQENIVIGSLGAAAGVVLGFACAWIISGIGISMPPPPNANVGYTALIRIVPGDVLTAALVGFVATVAAVVLPARRISRTPVVDALRQAK
ncbi:MAG: ABC transporter permease [Rhodocyclaceae bacterium]|nr:ABC transporter permease [Rhodocyclaceae bacterium]